MRSKTTKATEARRPNKSPPTLEERAADAEARASAGGSSSAPGKPGKASSRGNSRVDPKKKAKATEGRARADAEKAGTAALASLLPRSRSTESARSTDSETEIDEGEISQALTTRIEYRHDSGVHENGETSGSTKRPRFDHAPEGDHERTVNKDPAERDSEDEDDLPVESTWGVDRNGLDRPLSPEF